MSAAAFAASLAAASVAAQEENVVVDVRFAGLANVNPHEKDEAAYRALMLLGERIAEIPHEAGGPDEARVGIELVWDLFRGAHALRVERTQEAPGLGIAFTLAPEAPMDGGSYLDKFARFVMETGGPVEEADEGYTLSTPVGLATMQSMDVGGRSSMAVRLGTDAPAETAVHTYDLPGDSESILSAHVNLQHLGNIVAQLIAEEDPRLGEIIEKYQWVIDEAPLVNVAYGRTSSHQVLTSRLVGGRTWLSRLGMKPEHSVTEGDFAIIPKDATIVSAFPFDLGFILEFIDTGIEQANDPDPFIEINEQFGFDVRGDVLENVGPRMVYYQSDSTGGGGLLSAVLITELRDPDRLVQTHAELIGRLNDFAAEQARGYVRVRTWKAAGRDVFSFATPGLPVPFEPTWAVVDSKLVVTPTPVGMVAAIRQIDTDGPSIADNALFQSAVLEILPDEGAASVTFSDTARFARQGYGGTNLLLSGLANAVRSPSAPEREAGVLMPEFGVFAEGIRPMGAVEYWEGDDYVALMRMDGSTVVEIAQMMGQIGGGQAVAAMVAMQVGVALPALERSRVTAKQMVSASQVRSLIQASIVYANDNDGKLPESYEQLVELGFISHEMLVSPVGPAWDERGDIVLRLGINPELANSFRADIVVAMDRAAYINGGIDVPVGFADGHVEILSHWQVDDLLDEEANQGAREEFELD